MGSADPVVAALGGTGGVAIAAPSEAKAAADAETLDADVISLRTAMGPVTAPTLSAGSVEPGIAVLASTHVGAAAGRKSIQHAETYRPGRRFTCMEEAGAGV